MKTIAWKRSKGSMAAQEVRFAPPPDAPAEVKRRFGSMAVIRELLEMKNEIRALRNEPALSLDDYMAELAAKL